MKCNIAIIGGGISGLSLALLLSQKHQNIAVFEAAPKCGGRARAINKYPLTKSSLKSNTNNHLFPQYLDNGPHLIIGAYRNFFKILKLADVDVNKAFTVHPFSWHSQKFRLNIGDGNLISALIKAAIQTSGISIVKRLELIKTLSSLYIKDQNIIQNLTVSQWLAKLKISQEIQTQFFNPLCLSALNTPANIASAGCFANVLSETFFNRQDKNWMMYFAKSDLSTTIINPLIKKIASIPKNLVVNNSRIKKIGLDKQGYLLEDNHQNTHFCEKLIIATNPSQTLKLLSENLKIINYPKVINQLKKITASPITSVYGFINSKTKNDLQNFLPIIQHQFFQEHDIIWLNFHHIRNNIYLDNSQPHLCAIYSASALTDSSTITNLAFTELLKHKKIKQNPKFKWLAITEKQATSQSNLAKEKINPQINQNLYLSGDYLSDKLPSTIESASRSAFIVSEIINNA